MGEFADRSKWGRPTTYDPRLPNLKKHPAAIWKFRIVLHIASTLASLLVKCMLEGLFLLLVSVHHSPLDLALKGLKLCSF